MHAYGAPTHRLEDAVNRAAAALELRLAVLATPTSLQMAFGPIGEQRVHLLRVEPDAMDLGRLAELDDIVLALEAERNEGRSPNVAAARAQVEALRARPARYARGWQWAAQALASATGAPLFGGGWREAALAGLLGASLGPLASVIGRKRGGAGLFEPLAAFWGATVAFSAAALWTAGAALIPEVIVLSAVIVLLPGLRLTVGISELATGHVVSGTARLASAGAVFALMLLGIITGRAVAASLFGAPLPATVDVAASPGAAFWVGLSLAPIAFVVLFNARPTELGWIAVGGIGGVLVAHSLAPLLGPALASFSGAAFIGLLANELDRRKRLPASVLRAPGLIMLVPGGLGLRSLDAIYHQDALGGLEGLFSTTLIGVALAGGILVANFVRAPRGAL